MQVICEAKRGAYDWKNPVDWALRAEQRLVTKVALGDSEAVQKEMRVAQDLHLADAYLKHGEVAVLSKQLALAAVSSSLEGAEAHEALRGLNRLNVSAVKAVQLGMQEINVDDVNNLREFLEHLGTAVAREYPKGGQSAVDDMNKIIKLMDDFKTGDVKAIQDLIASSKEIAGTYSIAQKIRNSEVQKLSMFESSIHDMEAALLKVITKEIAKRIPEMAKKIAAIAKAVSESTSVEILQENLTKLQEMLNKDKEASAEEKARTSDFLKASSALVNAKESQHVDGLAAAIEVVESSQIVAPKLIEDLMVNTMKWQVAAAGGKTGQISIHLFWASDQGSAESVECDLHCICPCGFKVTSAVNKRCCPDCALQIDGDDRGTEEQSIKTIFFPRGQKVNVGTYKARVIAFRGSPVPYKVLVSAGTEFRLFRGVPNRDFNEDIPNEGTKTRKGAEICEIRWSSESAVSICV
eukprot:gnl/TRDRNA2_/TRDRNA2_126119_c2_seq1.p1 gnl/TRDRNA2_/TRDRNA2_126119_c2~~gnl/TRDRNA2_/TRDRNA2_126119_c2_seq1.p1  ORF type:complete len:466 (-),score=110.16 gnl/TRDRNA2_/TRDRNA2_126119_c2_seq1:58-1455(-)